MRTRHGARLLSRTGTAPAALAAVALMFSLTACGLGDDGGSDGKGSDPAPAGSSSEQPGGQNGAGGAEQPEDGSGGDKGEDKGPLATISGAGGFQLTIRRAERDSGGFLTISGILKNGGGKSQFPPLDWSGNETKVSQTGPSLAGMTLVDKSTKKRYYVLRDTENNPLTTTGLTTMEPGQSLDFFAQYPAPPAATKSVDVLLPLMPTATIGLS
ncbi:hypothetical protein [Streptomyces sp. NPDC058953]|uniref:hypothetical protein n=1 Tax=unclassified Streptomyces TaxID=2593676 RepID=UPI0036B4C5FB